MNKYIFIAVNYNGSNHTIKYINSINNLVSKKNNIAIIIVDNNSNYEDYLKIKKFSNDLLNVEILRLKENIGYFRGLNEGIKISEKENSFFIVGNNDITFDESFIENLNKIVFNEETLVIAPNVITKDGRQQNPHVIKSVSRIEKIKSSIYFSNYYLGQLLRFLNQKLKNKYSKPKPFMNNYGQMFIKRGIGACYILTPYFFKYFQKLDDRVFMWGEEALLSNQVESVGGRTLYDPSIKLIHHESAAVKKIQNRHRYEITRESYKIYRKYL